MEGGYPREWALIEKWVGWPVSAGSGCDTEVCVGQFESDRMLFKGGALK